MSPKAIVTGGAGFIGSHVAARLREHFDVVVFDNLSTGHRNNLEGLGVRLVEGDIGDKELLRRVCDGAAAILHLAAKISVAESMQDPAAAVVTNTIGTLNVLDAARHCGVPKVVLSSSAAIYGDNPESPKRESMLPKPKSPYAVSKLDGECYLRMYREEHGLQAVSLRYFNVFGPRQDPNSPYAAAIPSFVKRAIAGEDIVIFGDGKQTRDFVYVDDVARANVLAARVDMRGGLSDGGAHSAGAPPGEMRGETAAYPWVFNIARGQSITIDELARTIVRMTGSDSRIAYGPPREGDVRHSLAEVSRARGRLGFEAASGLEQGLEKTVAYFVERLGG